MTSKLITSVSAIAFLFGAGVAPAIAGEEEQMSDPAAMEDQSAQLEGQAVFDANGQEVGTVEKIVSAEDGTQTAILSVGGFLGIGVKKIAVSADTLEPNAEGTGVTVALTAEEIEAAPAYEDPAASETESY